MPTARRRPWGDNNWLGHGYIDHLDSTAGQVTPIDATAFHNRFENLFFDGFKYNPKIKLTERAQREEKLLGIAGSMIYKTSYQEHAGEHQDLPALDCGMAACRRISGSCPGTWSRCRRSRSRSRSATCARTGCSTPPMRPSCSASRWSKCRNGESAIRLRAERDALDMPMVEVDWQVDGRELDTIATFAERVGAALRAAGLANLEIDPKLLARDPAYLTTASDTYHQMGGARMGFDPADGVVDENMAVFGIAGLHVAGAATFPQHRFSPTAP